MAETEMVERVAAAIYFARNGPGAVTWSLRDATHKAPYRTDARAAISALREPTEAMKRAWRGPEPWDDDAAEVWRGLIDAALSPKE